MASLVGMTDQELRRYAAVILEVGVALREGQDLAINAHLEHADFARVLCDEAYRRGAALVDVWYWDPHTKLARLSHAPTATLSRTPEWLDARYRALAAGDGALVNLAGDPEPDLLRCVDQARAGLDRMPGLTSRFAVQARNEVSWCFAAVPTAGWARQVFGEPDAERLWRELATVMRLGEADPVAAWWRRMHELDARCAALDEQRFAGLRYEGPGTDLRVALPEGHRWGTAQLRSRSGARHVAALPTEEIFTTPDPAGTEGRVRASKPLALGGTLVEQLELTFAGGRVTDVRAAAGADVVRAQMALDEGASRLGEVALVDDSSPLQQSGVLFYDTLLDESAASHIAWGSGIPDGHRDYDPQRPETLEGLPINHSVTHVDFMIGGPQLAVSGVRADGTSVPILEGERWALG
jgi:aminopeptidase